MELIARAEMVRGIRRGERKSIINLISYINQYILDTPLEMHETFFDTKLMNEFMEKFNLKDLKILLIYTIVIEIIENFQFLRFLEKAPDEKKDFLKSEFNKIFKRAREKLNLEFKNKADNKEIIKQITKIKKKKLAKPENTENQQKADKPEKILESYRNQISNLKTSSDVKSTLELFFYKTHITLIPKIKNTNQKSINYQLSNYMIQIDKEKKENGK